MNTIEQAQAFKHQVAVEQLLQLVTETTRRWNALSPREKIAAWVEHQFTPAHLRPFNEFHRMVEAMVEVH